MKFHELVALFNTYTGAEGYADNTQLAQWFNEAQLDLSYDLARATETTISENNYTPPSDCLRIVDCSTDYEVTPTGNIMFASVPCKLYYVALPEPFTGSDTEQESSLDQPLHYLMALFAASRYWDLESEGDTEESGHANKWMGYYLQAKALAKSRMNLFGNKIDRWRIE